MTQTHHTAPTARRTAPRPHDDDAARARSHGRPATEAAHQRCELLGAAVDPLTMDETVAAIEQLLEDGGHGHNHLAMNAAKLVLGRKVLAGSLIGGIAETQEVLDFCAEHGITCDIEMLDIRHINEAYSRMIAGDVKYRFVIDMATLKA